MSSRGPLHRHRMYRGVKETCVDKKVSYRCLNQKGGGGGTSFSGFFFLLNESLVLVRS